MSKVINTLCIIAVIVALLCFAIAAGKQKGYQDCLQEAVDKGVGEWVIEYQQADFSDVKRSFRWKLPR